MTKLKLDIFYEPDREMFFYAQAETDGGGIYCSSNGSTWVCTNVTSGEYSLIHYIDDYYAINSDKLFVLDKTEWRDMGNNGQFRKTIEEKFFAFLPYLWE